MEVDPPTSTSAGSGQNGGSTLKRSNSAPMINLLVSTEPEISPPSLVFKATNSTAIRRLSSSNASLQGSPAPASPPIRGTDRIARLKQEEIHISDREKQHEKEIQSSFWISNNWGHLKFDAPEPMDGPRRHRSYSESLHIMTQSSILCGSPSPTRGGVKQCFSPSQQIPVRSKAFTPSPSPSPTRKNFMRSLSPIAVRTGPLKRKLETDADRCDYISPPKKFNTGPGTPDRMTGYSHPLAHSISSGHDLPSSSCDPAPSRSPHHRSSSFSLSRAISSLSPLSSSGPSPHHLGDAPSCSGLLKPSFLFRPVSESLLASPSSTTSTSSSGSSSLCLPHQEGSPLPHRVPLLGSFHSSPSPLASVSSSECSGMTDRKVRQVPDSLPMITSVLTMRSDCSPMISSSMAIQEPTVISMADSSTSSSQLLLDQPRHGEGAQAAGVAEQHQHQRMSSDSNGCVQHQDVTMSDADSRQGFQGNPGGANFNFKPISPDHT